MELQLIKDHMIGRWVAIDDDGGVYVPAEIIEVFDHGAPAGLLRYEDGSTILRRDLFGDRMFDTKDKAAAAAAAINGDG